MSRYKEWMRLWDEKKPAAPMPHSSGNKTATASAIISDDMWEKYCDAEKKIYSEILKAPDTPIEGNFLELASKYDVDPVMFMGFLDGVNTSLKTEIEDIEAVGDDTELKIEIDINKLYFNMQAAKADHLYTLPEWDSVLTDEEREKIVKEYKNSRTIRVPKTPGRNDPCPCGSGKKYKKCCGSAQAMV